MKKVICLFSLIIFMAFPLNAAEVSSFYDKDGKLVEVVAVVIHATYGHIPIVVNKDEVDLSLNADGSIKNGAAVKAKLKEKYSAEITRLGQEKTAVDTKDSLAAQRKTKLKLTVSDGDLK